MKTSKDCVIVSESCPYLNINGPVKVIRVIDGDTVDVVWRGMVERIRMLNINTPERGKPGYREATRALRKLIGHEPVMLKFERNGKPSRGRYGRLLAYLYKGDVNINVEMIRLGHSVYYVKYGLGRYPALFRHV